MIYYLMNKVIILNESKVIESIKNVCSKSAGSSMKIKIAAYNLLEYVSSSKGNYKKIVDLICKYFTEEYDYDASLTYPNEELKCLLSTCCTLLLFGKNINLNETGLQSKEYTENDIINII